jgi:hypothetical protein
MTVPTATPPDATSSVLPLLMVKELLTVERLEVVIASAGPLCGLEYLKR